MQITSAQRKLLHQAAFPQGANTSAFQGATVHALETRGLVRLEWRQSLRPDTRSGRHVPVRIALITDAGRAALKLKPRRDEYVPLSEQLKTARAELYAAQRRMAEAHAILSRLGSVLAEADAFIGRTGNCQLRARIRAELPVVRDWTAGATPTEHATCA